MTDQNIEIKLSLAPDILREALPSMGRDRPTNLQVGEKLEEDMIVKDDSWKNKLANSWKLVEVEKTLGMDIMRVTKFHPIMRSSFVFCLDGVDAFLVQRVERPSFIKKTNFFQRAKPRELVVYFHEAVSPGAEHQIKELLEASQKICAKLKMLDPVGTIIGLISWEGIQVERIDYSSFDYDSNSQANIKVTLSFTKEVREY